MASNSNPSKEELELSRTGMKNEDAGIPNLAFQPEGRIEQCTNNNIPNTADSKHKSSKYNYKQFLPFAPR